MQRLTVLITGVAGFIGSSLADRLVQEGYMVVGLCSDLVTARKRVPQNVQLHVCDIRSPDTYSLFKEANKKMVIIPGNHEDYSELKALCKKFPVP